MMPELGHFVLILALILASLQCILPLVGLVKRHERLMQVARPLVLGQCFFITLSFLCLVYAFVQDDFSVAYVAHHSNASLPLMYKISAVWGGHEGSLLLWVWLLSFWVLRFSFAARKFPLPFFAKSLSVLGILSIGFLIFLLKISNPFARFLPLYPIDGADLNPLLQDPGLIIHPPLLYMGYVGFAIPFAMAIAVLLPPGNQNHIDITDIPWAKWMRAWVLSAYGFLSIGIALGSWWAYYELGWGGWWFWDPVENASFMPWLGATAMIHSLMMSDKRRLYPLLSLLLAIVIFSLSLLGTFLVRSGILTSVHAFATDPTRGVFLLLFLGLVVGGALLLFAFQGKRFLTDSKIDWFSREAAMLISILFILVAFATVFLGTLFPLAYDAVTGQKLSVGFPYFNAVFIPLMSPVLLLIPLGPLSQWGKNVFTVLFNKVKESLVLSLMLAIVLPVIFKKSITFPVVLGLGLGLWILFGTLKYMIFKLQKGGIGAVSLGALGMFFAHAGIGVMVIGITVVSQFQIEREVEIHQGQSLTLADKLIFFEDIQKIEGPNFIGHRGHFIIKENTERSNVRSEVKPKKENEQENNLTRSTKKTPKSLYPEKRIYVVQGTRMTETAIDAGFFRDIYISLGEPLQKGGWSARIYYKPFVRWIWLGALMIAVGAFLAAVGRRVKIEKAYL